MLQYLSPAIDPELFTILLAHRPEYADVYARYPVDLALAGHAHGGQIRLPLMREGLYAPNQGFLPRYTNGSYQVGSLEMIVCRGLGNSIIPFRFLNGPELVMIELTNNGNRDTL
jgi:predicted MPP superfamily phosphohydrolase